VPVRRLHGSAEPSHSSQSLAFVRPMSRTIVLEKSYPHPIPHVWLALTDRRALAEWCLPNDFVAEKGAEFRFQVDPVGRFDGIIRCQITEIDPQRHLGYTYEPSGGKLLTHVAWWIDRAPGGTKLRLEHGGFAGVGGWLASNAARRNWTRMTRELLPRVLANIRNEHFTPGAIPLAERAYKAGQVDSQVELSEGTKG